MCNYFAFNVFALEYVNRIRTDIPVSGTKARNSILLNTINVAARDNNAMLVKIPSTYSFEEKMITAPAI